MESHSELQGKKWVSLKPTLATPAIAWSYDNITHGHISER
jgi:hypothetical protein